MAEQIMIVQTTVDTSAKARRLAERIIEQRLAACVHVSPPQLSVYRWKGRLEHAEECLLVMKTTASCLADLIDRLQDLHPYELPEIVYWPVETTAGYAGWCVDETARAQARRTTEDSCS